MTIENMISKISNIKEDIQEGRLKFFVILLFVFISIISKILVMFSIKIIEFTISLYQYIKNREYRGLINKIKNSNKFNRFKVYIQKFWFILIDKDYDQYKLERDNFNYTDKIRVDKQKRVNENINKRLKALIFDVILLSFGLFVLVISLMFWNFIGFIFGTIISFSSVYLINFYFERKKKVDYRDKFEILEVVDAKKSKYESVEDETEINLDKKEEKEEIEEKVLDEAKKLTKILEEEEKQKKTSEYKICDECEREFKGEGKICKICRTKLNEKKRKEEEETKKKPKKKKNIEFENCSWCGNKIVKGAKKCPYCGEFLNNESDESSVSQEDRVSEEFDAKKKIRSIKEIREELSDSEKELFNENEEEEFL